MQRGTGGELVGAATLKQSARRLEPRTAPVDEPRISRTSWRGAGCPSRPQWRLSTIGVKAARRLCPEVTPPTKAQIKRELKQIDAKRKALALGEHRIALQS